MLQHRMFITPEVCYNTGCFMTPDVFLTPDVCYNTGCFMTTDVCYNTGCVLSHRMCYHTGCVITPDVCCSVSRKRQLLKQVVLSSFFCLLLVITPGVCYHTGSVLLSIPGSDSSSSKWCCRASQRTDRCSDFSPSISTCSTGWCEDGGA